MDIEQAKKLAKAVYAVNSGNKEGWREKMFQNRWRNFFTVWIYIAVCLFFLWLGYTRKDMFFFELYYWLWMGLATIFLILGVYTMFSYLGIIIRGKK
jgi:hypothetical protein